MQIFIKVLKDIKFNITETKKIIQYIFRFRDNYQV
jgi:hypothetical protein